MSMQRTFDDECGSTHASAYHKITNLRNTRDAESMVISVSIFKDAQAKTDDKVPVGSFACRVKGTDYTTYFGNAAVELVDKSEVVKAYEYLKAATAEYDGTEGTVTDV